MSIANERFFDGSSVIFQSVASSSVGGLNAPAPKEVDAMDIDDVSKSSGTPDLLFVLSDILSSEIFHRFFVGLGSAHAFQLRPVPCVKVLERITTSDRLEALLPLYALFMVFVQYLMNK